MHMAVSDDAALVLHTVPVYIPVKGADSSWTSPYLLLSTDAADVLWCLLMLCALVFVQVFHPWCQQW